MVADLNTLQYVFNLVRQVKKPIVKIYPNGTIIGTDEQLASLNILVPNFDLMIETDIPYIFNATEFSAFMRTIKNYEGNVKISFSPYGAKIINVKTKNVCDNTLINYIELNYDIDQLYNRVLSYQMNRILFNKDNIQVDNYDMLSMKVADGAKMFCINGKYLMSSFNAIHPSTKSDTVNLIIRDCDEYSFIAEFSIHKKKENYTLFEFLRFRKM